MVWPNAIATLFMLVAVASAVVEAYAVARWIARRCWTLLAVDC